MKVICDRRMPRCTQRRDPKPAHKAAEIVRRHPPRAVFGGDPLEEKETEGGREGERERERERERKRKRERERTEGEREQIEEHIGE